MTLRAILRAAERRAVAHALRVSATQTEAARRLGISREGLYKIRKRLGRAAR